MSPVLAGTYITFRAGSRPFRTSSPLGVGPSPVGQDSAGHLGIAPGPDGWTVRDLGSSNGTHLDGRRIRHERLPERARLNLGANGPLLSVRLAGAPAAPAKRPAPGPDVADDETRVMETPAPARKGRRGGAAAGEAPPPPAPRAPSPPPPPARPRSSHYRRPGEDEPREGAADLDDEDSGEIQGKKRDPRPEGTAQDAAALLQSRSGDLSLDEIADHYFSDRSDDEVGEHTRMVRYVYREQKKRQSRKWKWVVAAVLLLLVGAGGGLVYKFMAEERTRQLAIDLFYDMKTMELQLSRLEAAIRATGEEELIAQLRSNRAQMQQMRARCDSFLKDSGLLDPNLSDQDQIIVHVARLFGECELGMPPSFIAEVKSYIKKWQSSERMQNAIRRLQDRGYVDVIARAMQDNNLPPQFMYLGLQESNFNEHAIGPPTRFGIAKGAWQFIPTTAQEYGLRVGPLKDQAVVDPGDDRFNFMAATQAAARFLRDIYNTDAQASGLLVMASYNWGPNNIIQRIRTLPENPRERNFWALLQQYKIPQETYDYVFYIISAAVIGENPRLFGFDFDNPLRDYNLDTLM